MMEPSKSQAFAGGAAASSNDGAPVAQAMEEARVIPVQPGTSAGAGAAAPTQLQAQPGGTSLVPPGPGRADYRPPVGQWKDHCFACWHQWSPSCLVACFLPCLSLAMLSKRMGYAGWDKIFWLLVVLAVLGMCFGIFLPFYHIAVLVITFQLLIIIRAKFDIPALIGSTKDGCIAILADALAVVFCTPCVIAQMLRHTMDYTKKCDECNVTDSRIETLA